MKKILLSFALVSALLITACSSQNVRTEEKVGEKIMVKEMLGEELEKIVQDDNKKDTVLVLDVRSKEEYDSGHVKFAVNMPLDSLEQNINKLEEFKNKPVVTVCRSGRRSKKAADILVNNGFEDVSNAEGVINFKYNLVK